MSCDRAHEQASAGGGTGQPSNEQGGPFVPLGVHVAVLRQSMIRGGSDITEQRERQSAAWKIAIVGLCIAAIVNVLITFLHAVI